GRRHADVDDRGVGPGEADGAQQPGGVADLADDLDARVGQHPGDALARDHHVLGDDYAHGISSRYAVGGVDSVPRSGPTRWTSTGSGADRSPPSSSTVTTSRPSRRVTVTAATAASRRAASSTASAMAK